MNLSSYTGLDAIIYELEQTKQQVPYAFVATDRHSPDSNEQPPVLAASRIEY